MATDQYTAPTPLVDDDLGSTAIAICSPMLALGVLLYLTRITTRVRPTFRLNAADYVISAAVVFEILTYSFFVTAIHYGYGRHNVYLSAEDTAQVIRWMFGFEFSGLLASGLARVAVSLLLLQFKRDSRAWKATLWFMITLQILVLAGSQIFVLASCRPTRALWEVVPDARCVAPEVMWVDGWLYSGVALFEDTMCAIMPIFVLLKLDRSVVEKSLMCFLLALVMVATAASIMRIIYMKGFDFTSSDSFRMMFTFSIWCRIEELILVAASCAPFLKTAVESVFRHFNLPTFHNVVRDLNSYHSTNWVTPRGKVLGDFNRVESHQTGVPEEEYNVTNAA